MTTPCHRAGCLKPADIRHGDLLLCAAHYKTVGATDLRTQIEADALELVREWTAMDGSGDAALMLHGRDLADFRDQLADVISGRAS